MTSHSCSVTSASPPSIVAAPLLHLHSAMGLCLFLPALRLSFIVGAFFFSQPKRHRQNGVSLRCHFQIAQCHHTHLGAWRHRHHVEACCPSAAMPPLHSSRNDEGTELLRPKNE